ncbi:toxin-antitoxin system YwqK family antitoxin [Pedobacter sp.]|uniref:toxin-antitoxin system YwqK family antitoxin n=1 Tax=Pedobacter sp. TaxID=1411316 RepID=UPI003C3ECA7D
MIKYLTIIALVFVSSLALAQKEKPCGVKDGLQEGTCKEFFSNGKLKSVANFKKGKREGICTEYFENGQVKVSVNYTKDKRNGPCKYFHDNGQVDSEESYEYRDFAEVKKGVFRKFFPSGKQKENYKYIDGKLDGDYIAYYENGNLKETRKTYIKDLIQGELKLYYETGKIKMEEQYKDDLRDGQSISYHPNGAINCTVLFVNGKEGVKICKDDKGKIIGK